jgi:hypothetical protein
LKASGPTAANFVAGIAQKCPSWNHAKMARNNDKKALSRMVGMSGNASSTASNFGFRAD